MPNKKIRVVQISAFLMAARITEALRSRKTMFIVKRNHIMVTDFLILKRWRKIDVSIICGKCRTENNKFEVTCKQCGANLIFAGKKKYITETVEKRRLPFYIPLKEPFTDLLVRHVEQSEEWLFPSPYTSNPYTRQWAYELIKPMGHLVGLYSKNPDRKGESNLYNHWFRSQRLMQLGNEYGLDELELKAFSGIVKSETISRYAKKVKSYMGKMGLNL